MIERYDIEGMGHGTPLDTRGGEACGTAGPHMLEAGICSTRRIAAFWGLIEANAERSEARRPAMVLQEVPLAPKSARPTPPRANGVGAVIEDALRAAGLMR